MSESKAPALQAAKESNLSTLTELAALYPPVGTYDYGTAGFRTAADRLDSVALRMGVLAAIRSAGCAVSGGAQSSYAVGVMITASHNPEADNGVKLIDYTGGMLDMSWEGPATVLANAPVGDIASLVGEMLVKQARRAGADEPGGRLPAPLVIIGRDTRPSSASLAALAVKGAAALAASVVDYGVVTTPQLHWAVGTINARLAAPASPSAGVSVPALSEYFAQLAGSFARVTASIAAAGSSFSSSSASSSFSASSASAAAAASGAGPPVPAVKLLLDCANGVGAPAAAALQSAIALSSATVAGSAGSDMTLVNIGGAGTQVNAQCGADFVQKDKRLPANVNAAASVGLRLASVDGDADRLVYYFLTQGGATSTATSFDPVFHLLDGDKMTSLIADYIISLLRDAGIPLKAADAASSHGAENDDAASAVSIGAVQTAYANGASTAYLEKTGIPVVCACTGVKHLHHEALSFDIGVYFEANGHGTVIFSQHAVNVIATATTAASSSSSSDSSPLSRKASALRQLSELPSLINPYVGDALSDLLLVEAALAYKGWSLQQWDALYTDYPSKLDKVVVRDPKQVKTANAERTCTAPAGLQAAIDAEVAKVTHGRSFVRPSGTEPIVRVYAEAATETEALALSKAVKAAVLAILS